MDDVEATVLLEAEVLREDAHELIATAIAIRQRAEQLCVESQRIEIVAELGMKARAVHRAAP